jgi:RNase P/RNase MRP subunit POP5
MKKTKLKLKPSQRDSRRYFLFSDTNKDIEKIILDYLGIFGAARAGYMEVKSKNGRKIASIQRKSLDEVRAALALEGISILKVSGTIKGLEK